nr:ribonuclease H-like domain-containing protein [Tanacetum cinerariifolium]
SMTENKDKLDDFVQVKGGTVTFGGRDGKITRKSTIRTSKLNFENVYYMEELQNFNLFSVSQICDKKNKVLFTDDACLVLSKDFQLPYKSQVVLRIPRRHDLYTFNLSYIQPEQHINCLLAKASLEEYTKWHRRMARVNFKTINKLARHGLVEGFEHLHYVYDQKVVRPVWNNTRRVNHKNFANKITHPHPKRRFVPQAILTKSDKLKTVGTPVNTIRPVHTADSIPIMNYLRPISNAFKKGYSQAIGPFNRYSAYKKTIFNKEVNAVNASETNAILLVMKIMMVDLFPLEMVKVEYLKKLLDESQVLLRVPRKDNIYSVDLKSVVSTRGLTCLFAKATTDESNLWHMRLRKESNTKPPIRPNLFSWVFVLATKDETSMILKTFITGIENQLDCKIKVIRCDNRTEFKNSVMNQFYDMKGIKREFSVARTPQQNGYLVIKPHNKTPYDLIRGRPPLIDFMKPFRCPATILKTRDYLGKFNEKVDEGFFVGYSVVSHKDSAVDAGKMATEVDVSQVSDNGGQDDKVTRSEFEGLLQQKRQTKHINNTNSFNTVSTPINIARPLFVNDALPSPINAAGTLASTNAFKEHPFERFSPFKNIFSLPHVPIMTIINDTKIFGNAYDDEAVEEEVDMNNVFSSYTILDAPLTKFLKDHYKDQVIVSIETHVQIRQMTKINEEHARIEAIRLFLAYASFKDFVVNQMDVKSAFLYGKIEEKVYVCQPPDFEDPNFLDKLYKVEKALYGLHQAPIACQEKYVPDILKKFDFTTVKIATNPIEPNKALVKDAEVKDVDVHLYRSMIESLIYLTASRPDITFVVCACTRFQVTPKTSHLHAVKRIFRYLKGQPKLGLWYPKDLPFDLKAYSNSDYARASLDRKSTTGDKTVYKECEDRMERAATTASSLEAEQDSEAQTRFEAAFKQSNDPPFSRVHTLGSREDNIKLKGIDGILYKTTTAKVKKVNGQEQKQALVDKQKVIITEESIGRDLKFDDALKVLVLKLLLGMNSVALWHLLSSAKPTTKKLMFPRMAKHKEIYVISSHTKKVFANMRRQGQGFSGNVTSLFETMMVNAQEKVGLHTDSHHTPNDTRPFSSKPLKKIKQKRKQRQATEVHSPSSEIPVKESIPTTSDKFPLLVRKFPLLKRRDATTERIALLLKIGRLLSAIITLYLKVEDHIFKEQQVVSELEFGDSYEVPKESAATGLASDGKKGRTIAITTEDMQKRRNDVKARTTLLLALLDEHQLRFSKYKMAQELWAAILKTFGGNEATRKTKKNLLKQEYGNFKAEGKETHE